MLAKKAFYKSKTLIGVVVMALTWLMSLWGVEVVDAEVTAWAEHLLMGAGALVAVWGRLTVKEGVGLKTVGLTMYRVVPGGYRCGCSAPDAGRHKTGNNTDFTSFGLALAFGLGLLSLACPAPAWAADLAESASYTHHAWIAAVCFCLALVFVVVGNAALSLGFIPSAITTRVARVWAWIKNWWSVGVGLGAIVLVIVAVFALGGCGGKPIDVTYDTALTVTQLYTHVDDELADLEAALPPDGVTYIQTEILPVFVDAGDLLADANDLILKIPISQDCNATICPELIEADQYKAEARKLLVDVLRAIEKARKRWGKPGDVSIKSNHLEAMAHG